MASNTKEISSTKDVFDATLDLYGNINYLFNIIDDNGIESLSGNVAVGTILTYDDELVFLDNTIEETAIDTGIRSHRIKQDQNIFDLAVQLYGDVQYMFNLTDANTKIISLNNTQDFTGLEVQYAEQSFAVTEYFRKNGITITTAINETDLDRAFDLSFDLSFG